MNFELIRQQYKPEQIKWLLIAEAPPAIDDNRFFYYENVKTKDSLFIELIKVLYPIEFNKNSIPEIRLKKHEFLQKIMSDGFYLIDSVETPFEKNISSNQKLKKIINDRELLYKKILKLTTDKTKVILISATVYEGLYDFLKMKRINLINTQMIDFPGSGGQIKFRNKMTELMKKYGR